MSVLKSISNILNTSAEYSNYAANSLFSASHSACNLAGELCLSELLAAEEVDYITSSDDEGGTDLTGTDLTGTDLITGILLFPSIVAGLTGLVIGGLGCASYVTSKVFEAEKFMVDYIDGQFSVSYENDLIELGHNNTQLVVETGIVELGYNNTQPVIGSETTELVCGDTQFNHSYGFEVMELDYANSPVDLSLEVSLLSAPEVM